MVEFVEGRGWEQYLVSLVYVLSIAEVAGVDAQPTNLQ